jgi:hypothetical protein
MAAQRPCGSFDIGLGFAFRIRENLLETCEQPFVGFSHYSRPVKKHLVHPLSESRDHLFPKNIDYLFVGKINRVYS